MGKEILGVMTCPHCGNPDATIHMHEKNVRLYYRCYDGRGSNTMICGTVQIMGPKGQEYLKARLPKQDAIATNPPEPTKQDAIATPPPKQEPAPPPKGKGVTSTFLERFMAGDEE